MGNCSLPVDDRHKEPQEYGVEDKYMSTDVTERNAIVTVIKPTYDELNTILDGLPIGVYFKDIEHRFIYFNQACAAAFRFNEPADAWGRTDQHFFAAEYAEQCRRDEEAALKGGPPLIDKEELQSWLDGRRTWVLVSRFPRRNAKGEIVGIVGVAKDITRIKREVEQYRLAVEGARDGLWHRDPKTDVPPEVDGFLWR